MPVANVKSRWVGGKLEFYSPATDQTIIQLDGPNEIVAIPSGAGLTVAGVTVDENTLAMSGVTASAAELNTYVVNLDIADGSAEAVYYVVCPHAGTISKIWTVIDGAVDTANITITAAIGVTGVTNGVVTIATASSAAGDIDSATPSAANVVTAGQAVNFTVTGGGAGGTPRIHLAMEVTR
jgi:hypothetical protein